jgi:hypothetical protein
MNTTFNFNRLGLLLKRYFIENKTTEMTYWGILILVFTLIHNAETARTIIYIMGFIFAAKQFKIFAYTPGGMHYLLIPATHLEKLVCNILLTTVYFFTMITISYSIGNIIGTYLYNIVLSISNPVSWEFFGSTDVHSVGNNIDLLQGNVFLNMIVKFLVIQSIFMLGSVYFKRNAIGKTLLTLFAFTIFIGIIEVFFLKGIFGEMSFARNMHSFSFNADNSDLQESFRYGLNIFNYLLIPFLWIVTYFRLKEKQV